MDNDVSTPAAASRPPAPAGTSRRPLLIGAGAVAAALALVGSYLIGSQRADAASPSGAAAQLSTQAGSSALLVADAARAATATGAPLTAGITVTGTGVVTGTPDTLILQMGVSVERTTVSQALVAANSKAAAVQKSLRGSGVAARDVQTSGLSINPRYDDQGRTVTGYTVTESVTATLRDLGRAGAAIGAAVTSGGDAARVDGISLDLGDTSTLVVGARGAAFTAARQKAEQYAKAAGVRLGQVVALTDIVSTPTPVPYPAAGASTADADVPIAAGSRDVAVTVTVTFAIG